MTELPKELKMELELRQRVGSSYIDIQDVKDVVASWLEGDTERKRKELKKEVVAAKANRNSSNGDASRQYYEGMIAGLKIAIGFLGCGSEKEKDFSNSELTSSVPLKAQESENGCEKEEKNVRA